MPKNPLELALKSLSRRELEVYALAGWQKFHGVEPMTPHEMEEANRVVAKVELFCRKGVERIVLAGSPR